MQILLSGTAGKRSSGIGRTDAGTRSGGAWEHGRRADAGTRRHGDAVLRGGDGADGRWGETADVVTERMGGSSSTKYEVRSTKGILKHQTGKISLTQRREAAKLNLVIGHRSLVIGKTKKNFLASWRLE
jgi:hypothetical protein